MALIVVETMVIGMRTARDDGLGGSRRDGGGGGRRDDNSSSGIRDDNDNDEALNGGVGGLGISHRHGAYATLSRYDSEHTGASFTLFVSFFHWLHSH